MKDDWFADGQQAAKPGLALGSALEGVELLFVGHGRSLRAESGLAKRLY